MDDGASAASPSCMCEEGLSLYVQVLSTWAILQVVADDYGAHLGECECPELSVEDALQSAPARVVK